MTTDLETYDPMTGPQLDASLWAPLNFAGEDRVEPHARTTVADGTVTVDVPTFTRESQDVQGFDNCKHVVLSSETFRIPDEGAAFAVDIAVDHVGEDSADYRLGVASFCVFDAAGALVHNIFLTRDWTYAQHERLGDGFYSRIVNSPFQTIDTSAFRACRVELVPSESRATWSVNGQTIHDAAGLPALPEAVRLGFAFFTLVPVSDPAGSIRGQGARATWRNFRHGPIA